ncbi:MAG TPA: ATP-binding protein [Sedimenticola thiotaurini]|uniref:ATP-binding protein n=1 Tax=Sedimenticola thiotaurini TaxID=1543721 RepID=A0A831RKE0_9GAMM|nr:ATP-binding protein [Sedimenticola thiotaurini]
MTDIDLADVTLHIDQALDDDTLSRLESEYRQREGVVSVRINPDKPHLLLVEYNPKLIRSHDLLDVLRYQGLEGELIGL